MRQLNNLNHFIQTTMKKILLPVLLTVLCSVSAFALSRDSLVVGESKYSVDTVFHAKVGPGTTQTQLRLYNGAHGLNVFYLTVDIKTPNVKMRTLSGTDKVAGTQTPSSMAENHSTDGVHYFAGSNGDFYWTGGAATNGSSQVGTATGSSTVDREVYRTSSSSVSPYAFSYDIYGVPRVCKLDYSKGTATLGEQSVAFKGINNDSAPNNGITLYTPRFWGSTNQTSYANNCAEVTARLVEGDNFYAGCEYRLEVTSEASNTGDMAVPTDGFVIFACGNAKDFVANLKIGDIVTFDNVILTPEGERIIPECIVTGCPKNVGEGKNLYSTAERSDASARHPRTGIGYSEDKSKVIMMVVDGRQVSSAGVRTDDLADLMIYAGVYEGMNLDGGGSSTLYTEALGVRNNCSDGRERSVGNAIFAVLEAPEDSNIAEISYIDNSPEIPHLGMYTPQMMAFNQYGLCLSTDFKDFTLSCPAELGEIINDGKTLYVTGTGCHALTATYGNVSVSIPIVVSTASQVELTYPSIILDEKHPYSVQLYSIVGTNTKVPLNPAALSWTSVNNEIVTVDDNGLISAVANGTTQVVGKIGDTEVSQTVTVENPSSAIMPLATQDAVATWNTSKVSLSEATMTAFENGIAIDYTVRNKKGTKFTLSPGVAMYGIPYAVRIRINPGEAIINILSVNFSTSIESGVRTAEVTEIPLGKETTYDFVISDYYDAANHGIYPLELSSISLSIGDAAKEVRHVEIPGIELVYEESDGIEDVLVDGNESLKIAIIDGVAHLATPAEKITVTDLAGRVVATGSGSSIALPDGEGVLLITADGNTIKVVR